MSIESSLVTTLNQWGENHISLVRVLANDFVYAVIILSTLWFCAKILKTYPIGENFKLFITNLFVKGIVIFGIPIGIATVISELISKAYVRDRPFAADSSVHLLVPHSADGGMPSHHIVFMSALVATVYFYGRRFALFLGVMTVLSGIARVAAGIHYPSDLIAGAAIGIAVAYVYHIGLKKAFSSNKLLEWPNRIG